MARKSISIAHKYCTANARHLYHFCFEDAPNKRLHKTKDDYRLQDTTTYD